MNQPLNDNPLKASGRFGRLSYLAWTLLSSLLLYLILFVVAFIFGNGFNPESFANLSLPLMTLFGIVYLIFIYFFVVFMIRRLHDRNHSGWLGLMILIPVLNIIFAFYLLFAKGNPDTNNYGPQRATPAWEKVLGGLYIVIFLLGLVAAIMLPAYQNYALKSQQNQFEQSSLAE